jgi:hypothetical protein
MRGRMAGMRYRKLRIAWSVVWGLVAVLLIVLWVCSYWNMYSAIRLVSPTTCISPSIIEGQFEINWTDDPFTISLVTRNGPGWTGGIKSLNDYYVDDGTEGDGPHPFGSPILRNFAFETEMQVIPIWFPTMLFGLSAAAPWIKLSKRFSLRTLLIATTLVAAVLGVIMWSIRYEIPQATNRVVGCVRDCLRAADRVVGAKLQSPRPDEMAH